MPIASTYFAFIIYADYTTLMYIIKQQDFNNPQQLAAKIKKEIKLITNWLKRNRLSLNIIKSKFRSFHMLQRKITPDHVTDFNLLGINMQNN